MNNKAIDCLGDNGVCIPMSSYSSKTVKKQTNAQKIRAMTDEELAEFLAINIRGGSEKYLCADYGSGCYFPCKRNHVCEENVPKLYLDWLQSEAE